MIRRPAPRVAWMALALAMTLAPLAGCQKAAEVATEKAAEKAIEAQLSKEGQDAKVDLKDGGAKVTVTDAQGKTSQMEFGSAQLSEADVGVPFYPGAKLDDASSTRMAGPDGTMLSVGLRTPDSADKVAAFYRERLKAQSQGKDFVEISTGKDEVTMMAADEAAKSSTQVHVKAQDGGTHLQLIVTRGADKK